MNQITKMYGSEFNKYQQQYTSGFCSKLFLLVDYFCENLARTKNLPTRGLPVDSFDFYNLTEIPAHFQVVCIPRLYNVCDRPTIIFYTTLKRAVTRFIRDTPPPGENYTRR